MEPMKIDTSSGVLTRVLDKVDHWGPSNVFIKVDLRREPRNLTKGTVREAGSLP